MRRNGILALVAMLFVGASPEDSVKLVVVTYDQLGHAVKRHKGSVVLVDFWFDACLPCKKGFPKVLAMHQKYAKRGFVLLTVNVDDPADADLKAQVMTFLKSQNATTENLQLNEKPDIWAAKMGIDSLPAVFLFDRQGKLLRKWTDHVDYQQVEKRVVTELAAMED